VSEAVVVGSGPNGLACAAVLARAGVTVKVLEAGGEHRRRCPQQRADAAGLLHDDCAAVHVMAVGSPALNELGLEPPRP